MAHAQACWQARWDCTAEGFFFADSPPGGKLPLVMVPSGPVTLKGHPVRSFFPHLPGPIFPKRAKQQGNKMRECNVIGYEKGSMLAG